MKKLSLSLFALVSLLACGGGGNPTPDGGNQPMDSSTPSGDSGPTCAAPGFVCCTAGSGMAQQPACENDVPVCPESNPPSVRTPGTMCPVAQGDASAD
ncbi:MAG: hypothetical protein U0269_19560 [Polyangiales bacterium]